MRRIDAPRHGEEKRCGWSWNRDECAHSTTAIGRQRARHRDRAPYIPKTPPTSGLAFGPRLFGQVRRINTLDTAGPRCIERSSASDERNGGFARHNLENVDPRCGSGYIVGAGAGWKSSRPEQHFGSAVQTRSYRRGADAFRRRDRGEFSDLGSGHGASSYWRCARLAPGFPTHGARTSVSGATTSSSLMHAHPGQVAFCRHRGFSRWSTR